MNWWKRFKAKHWDAEFREGEVGPNYVFFPSIFKPRFRRLIERLLQQCEDNPLGALAVLAGILGSIATIIALVV